MRLLSILMMMSVVTGSAVATAQTAPSADEVHKSVARSLAFLDKGAWEWWDGYNQPGAAHGHPIFIKPAKVVYCASCHHLPMTVWCETEAKNRGYAVDVQSRDYLRDISLSTYVKDPQLKPVGQDKFGGSVLSLNTIYLSFMAASEQSPDESMRDAMKKFAAHIIEKQEADGSWKAGRTGYEAPIGDDTDVLTMQAILVLATAHERGLIGAEWEKSRDRGLAWLAKNKPSDLNQPLALRILMAKRFGGPDDVQALVKQLIGQQQIDGGWRQTEDRPSDAMATGQSLYVLAAVGADMENKAAVGRGQAFLLGSQLADGSWWVVSREKGRKGLASSHYGSGWATLGLIRTADAVAP
jgi:hypothetical protein